MILFTPNTVFNLLQFPFCVIQQFVKNPWLLQTSANLLDVVTHNNCANLEGTFNGGTINTANYKGIGMFYFLKTKQAPFRALLFSFLSTQAFCKLSCHAEHWHRLLLSICRDGSLPVLKCDKKTILEHKCQQNIVMVFNSAFLTLPFGQDAMMSVADLMFGRGCYIK